MANQSFEVTVIDQWPKLKLLVMRSGSVRHEGPRMYDIALSDFTPAVNDALRLAVESIVKERKGV